MRLRIQYAQLLDRFLMVLEAYWIPDWAHVGAEINFWGAGKPMQQNIGKQKRSSHAENEFPQGAAPKNPVYIYIYTYIYRERERETH